MHQNNRNSFFMGVVYLAALLVGLCSLTARGIEMPKPVTPFGSNASGTTSAATTSTGANSHVMENVGKNHPCHKLKEACESAGYYKGGFKEGKGLYKNCMQPLVSGQSVTGVSVSSGDISSCQQMKAQHKQNKGQK